MNTAAITRFVNSRSMVAVAGILMLAAARLAFQMDDIVYFTANRGILFPSANLWIADTWLTMVVNTAVILVTALTWMFVIQVFNPFRGFTTLPVSLFVIMMLSMPDLTDQLSTGTVLAFVMPGLLALLWSSFGDMARVRHVFLIFVILSALTMTQYCFAVYIPVFVIGCLQMKIFNIKTVIACILGLITPWWIVLGLGISDISALHAPQPGFTAEGVAADGAINLVLVAVITAVLLIIAWFANVMKILSLNSNLRSFNGSISMIAVFTLVAMAADYGNVACYLPTLMLVSSYQLAVFFGKSNDNMRFIPVITIMLGYVAIYVLRIIW